MQLSPEALSAAGYVAYESFAYQTELVAFVQQALRKRNRVTGAYLAANLLLLAAVTWEVIVILKTPHQGGAVLSHLSYGCALPFLLIPVHELLHGGAYRYLGAPRVSYIANWRKLVFAALADRFVVNRREFWLVAFTPFAVLTAVLVGLSFWLPPLWRLTLLMTTFVHAAFCSGDFALASYFWEQRPRDLVTFDDTASQRVWFYERAADAAVSTE